MRLIDADALTYEILSEYGADGGTEDVNTICGMVINAPTIDAEPVKHGEWINKDTIHDEKAKVITEWQEAQCSSCGKWHTTPYMYYFDHFNYCPNCGAKMKGTEE